MPDGNLTILSAERARRSQGLFVVETSPAGRHFPPVSELPRRRFHPADEGAVRLGVARLGPDVVEELLTLFQREAVKTGDWSLHDELSAAASGLTPEPPEAA